MVTEPADGPFAPPGFAETAALRAKRSEYTAAVLAAWKIVNSLPPAAVKENRGVIRCSKCRSAALQAWPVGDCVLIVTRGTRLPPDRDTSEPAAEWNREFTESMAPMSDVEWPAWYLRGHPLDPALDEYVARCRCSSYYGHIVTWSQVETSLRVRGRTVSSWPVFVATPTDPPSA